jgi:Zn-dependent M32 family carboxypeptidase
MASVTKLIKDFARSPKGQQLIEQAKEQASRPENRRKLEELRRRYTKRR